MATGINDVVDQLQLQRPGLSYAQVVNALVAAYCPIVVELPNLTDAQKHARVTRFSALARQLTPANSLPSGSLVIATVSLSRRSLPSAQRSGGLGESNDRAFHVNQRSGAARGDAVIDPSLSLRGGAPILTIWRERSMQSFLDALEIWFDHGAHVDVNLHHIAQAIVTVLAVINRHSRWRSLVTRIGSFRFAVGRNPEARRCDKHGDDHAMGIYVDHHCNIDVVSSRHRG